MHWKDIPVSKLPQIMKLASHKTEDIIELWDRDTALLEIITGNSVDYFNALTAKEFGSYRVKLYALLSTEPATEFKPMIKIGGRTFSTVVSAHDVPMSAIGDIHLLKITPQNYYEKLPYILAVFATERKRWFRKRLTFTQRVELFRDLPSDQANSISLFFCKVAPELERAIQNSLANKAKEVQNKLMNLLEEQAHLTGGDGTKRSTNSRTGTSRKNPRT